MTAPARYDPDLHGDYLDLDDCARRMGLTVDRVLELCRHRVLRSLNLGMGVVLVEPAIVSGAVN
ncbi:hypothetical protein P6281_16325 [Mycobacterium sp. 5-140-3-2]|uniref:hypothetical protein n=1 Tax=Mycobacterium TaxID=1763 RepID=UPI0019159C0F|nr:MULTISPECIES: hypothetical protein [Mycobacterium]WRU80657.1 hypothetical protein P6281_16325 [Mycobacterium sp. 5-140-3-2]WSE43190.1 hypothetical protein QGN28_09795 [Mycobacterium sp. 5-140-3-1]WVL46119.1 hypothetical protein KN248_012155 [Mycobacterium paraintracellulare]BCP05889.1 hypothetical protein MINTM019_33450 [Mycobacterium paraintracellulare]BCP11017.1 hypothetical protein MINTM020_31150 [Mycobacterium paraintracellulare]